MRGQIVVSKGFPGSRELSRAAARGDGRPESWGEGGRTHEALQVPALGDGGRVVRAPGDCCFLSLCPPWSPEGQWPPPRCGHWQRVNAVKGRGGRLVVLRCGLRIRLCGVRKWGRGWKPLFSLRWRLCRPCGGRGVQTVTGFLYCEVNILLGTSGLFLMLSEPLPDLGGGRVGPVRSRAGVSFPGPYPHHLPSPQQFPQLWPEPCDSLTPPACLPPVSIL